MNNLFEKNAAPNLFDLENDMKRIVNGGCFSLILFFLVLIVMSIFT